MKNIIYIFILVLGSCISVNAQYSIELKKMIREVKDASYTDSSKLFSLGAKTIEFLKQQGAIGAEAEINIYYGNHFFYKNNFPKAVIYFKKAVSIAEKSKAKSLERLAFIRISFVKYETGNTLVAENELKSFLKDAKTEKDYTNMVELYNLLGIIHEDNSDIKGALKYYLEGLSVAETQNLTYFPAVFANNIGLMKWSSGQKEEALRDFEHALDIAEKEGNSRLSSHIQLNICMIKVEGNNPEQALKIFDKVIKYAKENKLPKELATNYLNISSAFANANRFEEAMQYIDSSIVILKNDKSFEPALIKAYLAKANINIRINKLDEATKTLEIVFQLTNKTKNLEDIYNYHLAKYQIFEKQTNYQAALREYLNYSRIKDSLSEEVNSKVIQELQQSFDLHRKEIELEREHSKTLLLEESNENEKLLKWAAIAIGAVTIIILILILNNRYVRKLREKQQLFSSQLIENIDEERKRIAFDLHDDIGQSLSIIKSKIARSKLQDPNNIGELETSLSNVIEQTREISKNLYPSNIEKIGFTRSIALMMEAIQNSTQIVCSFDIEETIETLSLEQKTHLFRIVQECTNNTIKHSGASGLKLEIKEKNKEFNFVYQDNGKGIKTKKVSNGLGLKSLNERAKLLKGYIEVLDEKNLKGFKLIFNFKPTKA
jgi:two-component system NarL family sensor kinase